MLSGVNFSPSGRKLVDLSALQPVGSLIGDRPPLRSCSSFVEFETEDDEVALDAVWLRHPRAEGPALEAETLEQFEARAVLWQKAPAVRVLKPNPGARRIASASRRRPMPLRLCPSAT